MYFESIWQVFVWPVCSVSCTADICRSNGQVSSEHAHDIVNSAAQNGGMGGRERERQTRRQTDRDRNRETETHRETESHRENKKDEFDITERSKDRYDRFESGCKIIDFYPTLYQSSGPHWPSKRDLWRIFSSDNYHLYPGRMTTVYCSEIILQ